LIPAQLSFSRNDSGTSMTVQVRTTLPTNVTQSAAYCFVSLRMSEAEAAGNVAAEAARAGQGVPEVLAWRAATAAEHLLPLPAESWKLQSVWAYVAVAMEGEQLAGFGPTRIS
jgi:hypothetical protein